MTRKAKPAHTLVKPLFLHRNSVVKANDYAEEWNFIELGDQNSGDFSNGVNKNKEDYGDGCLFVNILDVFREFTIDPKQLKRVKVSDEEIKHYGLKKGDLILDRSSNILETVGYPTYFDGANESVVFSGFTFRFRPNPKIWNSKFLTFQLMSYSIRKLVISISTKSANSNVNQKSYKKIKIPYPPLREQQKIVSILSNVDNLIDSYEKTIESTKKLKKGLMQTLLTKGIGHKKFKKVKWLFGKEIEIPEEWEVKKISDCDVKVTTGSRNTQDKIENGKYPFYVRSQKIEKINTFSFDTEAILTAGDGVGTGKVFHYIKGKFDLHQRAYSISNFGKKLNGKFFYNYFQKNFLVRAMTMNANASVDSIRMDTITEMKILRPPLPEQQKIASILSSVDDEIFKLESKKKSAESLKKGLMQKLLTGQIRVAA